MKRILYTLLVITGILNSVNSQPLLQYSNTYFPDLGNGEEQGISIDYDQLGNAYVTGTTDGIFGNNDILTVKYSPNGTKLWTAVYSGIGNGDDRPVKIKYANNKVYVTGYTKGNGTGYDWITICYNATGSGTQPSNWESKYNDAYNGDDKTTDVGIDRGGNVYVSGTSYNGLGKTDAFLIKYNGINGIQIRTLGKGEGSSYDITSYSMTVSQNTNNVFFATSRYNYPYSYQGHNYVYTLDTAFNEIGFYRGDYFPAIIKIIQDNSNFYYAILFGSTGTSLAKIPINGSYNPTWVTGRFGAPDPTYTNIFDYDLDESGNPYVLWYDTISGGSLVNTFKWAKLNPSTGDTVFTRIFDPSNASDRPLQIKVGHQSTPTVYITGNSVVSGKLQNITVGYSSSTGNVLWSPLIQSCSGTGNKSIADMKLDNYNNIYMTGASSCSGNNDILAVKYCASLPVANAGVDNSVCQGSAVQIGSSSLPNYIYSWLPTTGLSNPSISNPSASPTGNTIYVLTVTSPSGCSSNDTVNVTVNLLPNTPIITQSHDTLFSNIVLAGATYNWYKGATNVSNTSTSFYKIPSNGSYTLKITNSTGCISTVSNSINATITALRNTSSIISSFELYPNPASQNLSIDIQSGKNMNIQMHILDMGGKEVYLKNIQVSKGENHQVLDVSRFTRGMYVLQINDEEGIITEKFIVE